MSTRDAGTLTRVASTEVKAVAIQVSLPGNGRIKLWMACHNNVDVIHRNLYTTYVFSVPQMDTIAGPEGIRDPDLMYMSKNLNQRIQESYERSSAHSAQVKSGIVNIQKTTCSPCEVMQASLFDLFSLPLDRPCTN